MLSLYFHIPFCEKKCNYCSFFIIPTKDFWCWIEKLKDKYLENLKKEIIFQKEKFNLWKEKIFTIYFWGGTPSEFGLHRYYDLLDFISNQFDLSFVEEFSIELNPKTGFQDRRNRVIGFEKQDVKINKLEYQLKNNWILNTVNFIKEFKKNFNFPLRFSIWIQSLNNNILKKSNRNYTFEEIEKLLFLLKDVDVILNLDFISFWIEKYFDKDYFQKFDSFVKKYKKLIDSYSVYTLELFEGSIWFDGKNFDWIDKNYWENSIYENFEEYKNILYKYGYERYEISNFSKKWKESKHNQVYWQMKEYLWFGTSASGFVNNIRYTNSYNINNYNRWIFDYKEYKILTKKEYLEEKVFLWLRTKNWVKLTSDIKNILNFDKLLDFEKQCYLKIKDNILYMQEKWFSIYNYIVTDILDF